MLRAGPPVELPRPSYRFDAQPGTRIRNGHTIRAFSIELGDAVQRALAAGRFPLVLGGDCSVLLGCLLGARQAGGRGLLHVDGNSDFFHPGNYDTTKALGSVAGMDLALATGRGEALLTEWPGIEGPLVADEDAIQIGERDAESPDFDGFYGDIVRTGITRVTIQDLLRLGVEATCRRVIGRLADRGLGSVWLHIDLDVLDQAVMPAVDSPGSPGLDFEGLAALIAGLVRSARVLGADVAIYDPELDPGGLYAEPIGRCLARGLEAIVARSG
jgi:arginase